LNRRRVIISLVFLTIVAAAAFFFADRIADGPFPRLSQGVRFFEEREPALNAYVRRLENDNQVARVICYTDEVWIDESKNGPRTELGGQRLKEYLTLCQDSGASLTWRVDGGYLLYMGTDSRSGRDFNFAFIWQDNKVDGPPECSSVVELGDFGKCVVPLGDSWVLDYEWMPSDYQSPREKEVMELAEDVARDAVAEPSP